MKKNKLAIVGLVFVSIILICMLSLDVNPLIIGGKEGCYSNNTIDEVAIYNRTLSAEEIREHYLRTKGKFIHKGEYTSEVFDGSIIRSWNNITWISNIGELPNNQEDQKAAGIYTGANMTGNVLLFHFNNDSSYGENNTYIYDFSGTGSNGTAYGNATTTSTGKFSGAFEFDGTGYIEINVSDAAAIEYWKKNNTDSEWYHIVNSSGILYVDGVAGSGQKIYVNKTVIGIDSAGNFFNGTIDEVAVYNRNLSASEILEHYLRGAMSINISVRSCNDLLCSGETWSGNYPTTDGSQTFSLAENRYFQYKAVFDSSFNDSVWSNYDLTGNYTPELHNVTISYSAESTLPAINLDEPINDTWQNEGNVTFKYTATDDTGIDTCTLYGNFNGLWEANKTDSSVSSGVQDSFELNLTSGTYLWNVWCNDSSGNSAFDYTNLTVTVDTILPNIELKGPVDNYNTTLSYIEFNWTATDNLDKSLTCNLTINSLVNESLIESANGSNTNITVTGFNEGTYYWNVTCWDNLNNTNISETRTFRRDTTAPIVNLETPANNSDWISSSAILFEYNVSDANDIKNCSLIINNKLNITNTTITKDITQNFTVQLSSGWNNWSVNCTDYADNTNYSVTYSLRVCGAGYVICGGVCYSQGSCPYCCDGACSSSECGAGEEEGGGGGGGGGGVEEEEEEVEEEEEEVEEEVVEEEEVEEEEEEVEEEEEKPPPSTVIDRIIDFFTGEGKGPLNITEETIPCVNTTVKREKPFEFKETEIKYNIPIGYSLILKPFNIDCTGETIDITLSVPEDYKDVKVMRCIGKQCSGMVVETVTQVRCGEKIVEEHIRKEEYIEPELFKVQINETQLNITALKRELESGKTRVKFVGEVFENISASIKEPREKVKQPINPSLRIIGTPLIISLSNNKSVSSVISLPFTYSDDIDNNSFAIYVKTEEGWDYIGGEIDYEEDVVSANVNLTDYLVENEAQFSVMGVICVNCYKSTMEKVYEAEGASKDALLLVHGLASSPETFSLIVNDIRLTKQPFDVYTFGYPSKKTVDEISIELINLIEQYSDEFDNLFIVAHSLGGLITQEAANKAYSAGTYKFVSKIRKIVLVGVPNEGSFIVENIESLYRLLVNKASNRFEFFNINDKIIDDLIKGKVTPRIPDVEYLVIAGTKPYEWTGSVVSLLTDEKNDGLITVKSAQRIGDEYVDDQCKDYWEIDVAHTDLIDNNVSRRLVEKIIADEILKLRNFESLLGANKYFEFSIEKCRAEEQFIVIGKPIRKEEVEDPTGCSCGNGYCGEGEDVFNCPSDCANLFTKERLEKLPLFLLLLILFILIWFFKRKRRKPRKEIKIYKRRVKKPRKERKLCRKLILLFGLGVRSICAKVREIRIRLLMEEGKYYGKIKRLCRRLILLFGFKARILYDKAREIYIKLPYREKEGFYNRIKRLYRRLILLFGFKARILYDKAREIYIGLPDKWKEEYYGKIKRLYRKLSLLRGFKARKLYAKAREIYIKLPDEEKEEFYNRIKKLDRKLDLLDGSLDDVEELVKKGEGDKARKLYAKAREIYIKLPDEEKERYYDKIKELYERLKIKK